MTAPVVPAPVVVAPVVVVTGCSSGIGLATAVAFAAEGWDVVATMRDLSRDGSLRATLGDLPADLRRLDVNSDESVATTMAAILADHGKIDAIVSNAGIGIDGTTEELSVDDFRAAFETNALGTVRLLHAVLPTWRQRRAGRFIAVSSIAGVFSSPFNDAYCASKFALEAILEALHPVISPFGVHVSLVQAGPVAGDFVGHSGPPTRHLDGNPYDASRARFQAVQAGGYAAAQSPADIAAVLLRVAGEERPVLRYQTSETVARMVGLKLKDLSGERITGVTGTWA